MQVVDRVEVHVLNVERKHASPHARVQHRGGDAGQIRLQELQDCVLRVKVVVRRERGGPEACEGVEKSVGWKVGQHNLEADGGRQLNTKEASAAESSGNAQQQSKL